MTRSVVVALAAAALAAPPQPRTERAAPFRTGETLTYDVSWSNYLTAGTAVSTVREKRPSFNSTAYYIVAEGRTTPLLSKLYPVYYKLDTLFDAYTLLPQRGSIYSEEGRRHRYRTTLFDRAARTARFEAQGETTTTTDLSVPPNAQDALSTLYAIRAMAFKTGDRITMPVCDNGSAYKLLIDVGPVERVQTGLGDGSALRLNLTLFDAHDKQVGRNTAMWVSDDARRLPVRLQTELPVGSFSLILRDVR
jgi:hypothetical protein